MKIRSEEIVAQPTPDVPLNLKAIEAILWRATHKLDSIKLLSIWHSNLIIFDAINVIRFGTANFCRRSINFKFRWRCGQKSNTIQQQQWHWQQWYNNSRGLHTPKGIHDQNFLSQNFAARTLA